MVLQSLQIAEYREHCMEVVTAAIVESKIMEDVLTNAIRVSSVLRTSVRVR